MAVRIIDYANQYKADFRRLNLEWLDAYQLTESHDLQLLDDPQSTVLDRGGFIWLAFDEDLPVGSAALCREHEGIYELAKMAVTASHRGKGISKKLIEACLQKAKELKAHTIFLYSNHQLTSALKLYEQYGFKHIELGNSPFDTADVKMQLLL